MELLIGGVQVGGLVIFIYGLVRTGLTRSESDPAGYDWPQEPSRARPCRRAKAIAVMGVALFGLGAIVTLHA